MEAQLLGFYVAIAGLAVTVAGLWMTVLKDRRGILASRSERDSKVDLRLERLDTKMETVWSAFTARLLTDLHHPDPAKIIPDALLKKYEASLIEPTAIDVNGLQELIGYMIQVAKNEALELDERVSAVQLLRLIRHHPLWQPTEEQRAELEAVIGPDLHPRALEEKTTKAGSERSTEHTDKIVADIRDKLEDKR